jgi:hypothetical protein
MPLGEDVDEFALGLVTPLQTDDACARHVRRILTLKSNGTSLAEAAVMRPPGTA